MNGSDSCVPDACGPNSTITVQVPPCGDSAWSCAPCTFASPVELAELSTVLVAYASASPAGSTSQAPNDWLGLLPSVTVVLSSGEPEGTLSW